MWLKKNRLTRSRPRLQLSKKQGFRRRLRSLCCYLKQIWYLFCSKCWWIGFLTMRAIPPWLIRRNVGWYVDPQPTNTKPCQRSRGVNIPFWEGAVWSSASEEISFFLNPVWGVKETPILSQNGLKVEKLTGVDPSAVCVDPRTVAPLHKFVGII